MIIGLSGYGPNGESAGTGKDTVADFLVEKHGFVKVALADPIKRAAMEWWDFTEEQLWGPSEMRNIPDERYPLGHTAPDMGWRCKYCEELWNVPGVCRFLTPREALQKIGTEVGRAIDPDVWVRLTLRIADQLLNEHERGDAYVGFEYAEYHRTKGVIYRQQMPGSGREAPRGVAISDCRFINEFDAIKNPYKHIWSVDEHDDLVAKRVPATKIVRIKRGSLNELMEQDENRAELTADQKKHRSETEQLEVPDDRFDHLIYNTGGLDYLSKLTDRMMDIFKGNIREYDESQKDVPPFKRD